jgi:hypothetical protein
MNNNELGEPVARYAFFDQTLNGYNATVGACADYVYKDFIDYLKQTSWNDPAVQSGCISILRFIRNF